MLTRKTAENDVSPPPTGKMLSAFAKKKKKSKQEVQTNHEWFYDAAVAHQPRLTKQKSWN